MPCIFIDGEAGTTGLDIRKRLDALKIDVLFIDPALRKDPQARLEKMHQADLVILCLPDEAALEAAMLLSGREDIRVLDASSAHRVHADWVYGFPELDPAQPAKIADALRVSNPGCYPTGAIALLRPLMRAGILPPQYPLTINAVSGYSGGGHTAIARHEHEGGPAFSLYALGLEHKHVPEIVQHAQLQRRPLFVPSVGHFPQGMIVSIPLHLDLLGNAVTPEQIRQCLKAAYDGRSNVVVMDDAPSQLVGEALAGSDRMELRVHANAVRHHVLLTACLDNLGKGAGGAAVNNALLMLGL